MILGRLGRVAEVNKGGGGMKIYAGLLKETAWFESEDISGTNI